MEITYSQIVNFQKVQQFRTIARAPRMVDDLVLLPRKNTTWIFRARNTHEKLLTLVLRLLGISNNALRDNLSETKRTRKNISYTQLLNLQAAQVAVGESDR